MGPSRYHIYCFNLVSGYFEFDFFSGIDIPFLYQSMAGHYNKLFPLTVVPMLTFCDSRLTDINGYLSTIHRVNQFCKGASRILIHLQLIFEFFRR